MASKKRNVDVESDKSADDNVKKNQKQKKINKINKIVKNNSKPGNEQKERKQDEGVKKGRPPQSQKMVVAEDPTSDIQQKLLQYLESIGLKHGLVFRKQDRQKLIKQNSKQQNPKKKIQWNKDHTWDMDKQKLKINSNQQIKTQINTYLQKNSNTKFTYMDLVQMFLNIGDISADQCTQQIYLCLALGLYFINNQIQNDQEIINKIDQLYDKLIFLNGKFTKLNIQYWIQIQKQQHKIKIQFQQMVKNVKKQLKQILQNQQKLINYIKQQREMDQQLQKIISIGQKNSKNYNNCNNIGNSNHFH